jgi:copper chaperone CopZ
MKKLVSVLLLVGGVSLGYSHDLPGWPGHPYDIAVVNQSSVEIKIPGLVCESCAIGIKKKLKTVFSFNAVSMKFDTKKQTCTVIVNNSSFKIDDKKIKLAVKDAGYEVKWIKVRKVSVA